MVELLDAGFVKPNVVGSPPHPEFALRVDNSPTKSDNPGLGGATRFGAQNRDGHVGQYSQSG